MEFGRKGAAGFRQHRPTASVSGRDSWGRVYLSGELKVLSLPNHHNFTALRHTLVQTRCLLNEMGREYAEFSFNQYLRQFQNRAVFAAKNRLFFKPVLVLAKVLLMWTDFYATD